MISRKHIALATLALLAAPFALAEDEHDAVAKPIDCSNCAKWNVPQAPFKVVGNTWYVGTKELSVVLISGPEGHILIDAALPQSVPMIEQHIESLGFKVRDIKFILSSHPHFDHGGGLARLARDSGAVVVSSAPGARVLRAGVIDSDDPQFDPKGNTHFAKVAAVRTVADGEVIGVGPLKVTAHMTPGHTPGGASYTWQSCEDQRCLNVAYIDSLNPASTEGYFFSGDAHTPDITPAFAATIAKVAALPCDVVLSAHPDFSDTLDKLAARTPAHNTFIDPNGCKDYAADARKRLDARLDRERAEKEKAAH